MQLLLSRRVLVLFFCGFLALVHTSRAQDNVIFDWQGGTGGTLKTYPIDLNSTRRVKLTVDNVNNLLYTYGVTGSCVQNAADPWGAISSLMAPTTTAVAAPAATQKDLKQTSGPQAAPPPTACQTAVPTSNASAKQFRSDYNAFMKTPVTIPGCTATAPCRIPLSDSEDAESAIQAELSGALADVDNAIKACRSAGDTQAVPDLTANQVALQTVQNRLTRVMTAPHRFSTWVSVPPDSTCNFTIIESSNGTPTKPAQTIQFVAGQPRMTLSAGALVSELQPRSYSTVTAPPASGSTTNQTELQVNGRSRFNFYLTGLVNIAVPVSWLNSERIGTAISAGPVVRVGSQSTSFPVGFFAGGSLHLMHLIYLSAGAHVGQFSDYPAGFTAPGQVVPSGFPTPVGQDRTSVRFAFAITFKAKDLSALGSKTGK